MKRFKKEKIPKWVYIFIVLNLLNLINGLIGVLFTYLGISLTLKVSLLKTNIFFKIILCILIYIYVCLCILATANFINTYLLTIF